MFCFIFQPLSNCVKSHKMIACKYCVKHLSSKHAFLIIQLNGILSEYAFRVWHKTNVTVLKYLN